MMKTIMIVIIYDSQVNSNSASMLFLSSRACSMEYMAFAYAMRRHGRTQSSDFGHWLF